MQYISAHGYQFFNVPSKKCKNGKIVKEYKLRDYSVGNVQLEKVWKCTRERRYIYTYIQNCYYVW